MGGRGVIAGRRAGVWPCPLVVIACNVVGTHAGHVSQRMGADVTCLTGPCRALRYLDGVSMARFQPRLMPAGNTIEWRARPHDHRAVLDPRTHSTETDQPRAQLASELARRRRWWTIAIDPRRLLETSKAETTHPRSEIDTVRWHHCNILRLPTLPRRRRADLTHRLANATTASIHADTHSD